MTAENNQISITAPGSSRQLPPEAPSPNRLEMQMEDDQENPSTFTGPPDEAKTDDNFTLSGAATPAQDDPDMGMSQMDAAGIESELNNLLTIDDSSQYPPSEQTWSQRLTLNPNLQSNQYEERKYHSC